MGWGGSSVVGVGVIVGDGAERESVLRLDCLPSGEKLCQHPLKRRASQRKKPRCSDKSEREFFGADKSDRSPASSSHSMSGVVLVVGRKLKRGLCFESNC